MLPGSLVLCLLCIGLTQVSDPSIFGVNEEPERIMFYGGFGVLAGLFGLAAAVSGVYLGVTRFTGLSAGQRRLILTVIWTVLIAVLIASNIPLARSYKLALMASKPVNMESVEEYIHKVSRVPWLLSG